MAAASGVLCLGPRSQMSVFTLPKRSVLTPDLKCLFATIPYEEIVLAAAGNLSGDEVNALGFLRTPRLLRLGSAHDGALCSLLALSGQGEDLVREAQKVAVVCAPHLGKMEGLLVVSLPDLHHLLFLWSKSCSAGFWHMDVTMQPAPNPNGAIVQPSQDIPSLNVHVLSCISTASSHWYKLVHDCFVGFEELPVTCLQVQ
eukprot:scaffold203316_cov20-Tisochrysis_lutea.AAC.1